VVDPDLRPKSFPAFPHNYFQKNLDPWEQSGPADDGCLYHITTGIKRGNSI
jgi:hypothetical protein